MRRKITFQTYRLIDLGLFMIMLVLFETLIVLAYSRWFPEQPYTVSVVGAITSIVLFRWGPFAGIYAAGSALLFCALSGATLQQYVIYIIGNLFSMIMFLPIHILGWKRIRDNVLYCMAFGLGVVLLMQAGRAVMGLLFGYSFLIVVNFILTDILSGLFTVVILWIARRLDGVLEDQNHYLLRMSKEESESAGGTETWQ